MKCVFCGEREATTQIPNPNMPDIDDPDQYCDVCEICKQSIRGALKQSMEEMLKVKKKEHGLTEKSKFLNNINR